MEWTLTKYYYRGYCNTPRRVVSIQCGDSKKWFAECIKGILVTCSLLLLVLFSKTRLWNGLLPSFFMPALKHFFSLQYRHWFLLSLSTIHCLLNLEKKKDWSIKSELVLAIPRHTVVYCFYHMAPFLKKMTVHSSTLEAWNVVILIGQLSLSKNLTEKWCNI